MTYRLGSIPDRSKNFGARKYGALSWFTGALPVKFCPSNFAWSSGTSKYRNQNTCLAAIFLGE